ncbi:MAG: restriction alleviation protein, Lar family [Desulfobacterales bacterium]|nr:restriction alleviation protein, Lar family [Desulfobacterales bacterium]
MVEVKPCPFCGMKSVEICDEDETGFVIECPKCKTLGPVGETEEKMIQLWNRRPR